MDMLHEIRSLGYEAESHVVETGDGYLLQIFRMPANKNGERGKQAVFLQHGIMSSCSDWLETGPRSLGAFLADNGYDVWMGNARGNFYSKKHVVLSERDNKFWDFSFHEMGLYDIPAILKHIEKIANKDNVIYIGHSMGTSMFFVFSSLLPNVAKKVKAMVALAPVAIMRNIKSPIKHIAPLSSELESVTKAMGVNEVFPKSTIYKYLAYDSNMIDISMKVCRKFLRAFCGLDREEFDAKLISAILANKPAGTSTKTFIHYTQIIKNRGDFAFFDYGFAGNKKRYGTRRPPLYQLENIKVPMLLAYGKNDWFASPEDVKELSKRLTNKPEIYEVPCKYFNHADFLWAKDCVKLIYNPLLNFIQKYTIK